MTPEQAIEHLINLIEGDSRHDHYDATVDIAQEAQELLSRHTQDQKDTLRRLTFRETEKQTEKRIELTNPLTGAAMAPVLSYFSEVWRTDAVTMGIETGNAQAEQRLNEHYGKFVGEDSLHKYCFDAALHYNKYDPNAWTIFQRIIGQGQSGESIITDIYPIEVKSDEAIDYKFDNTGKLEYLVTHFETSVPMRKGSGMVTIHDYLLFAIGFGIHLIENNPDAQDERDYEALGYQPMNIDGTTYWYLMFENGTTEVPAIRWSAYKSGKHNRKIGVTLFDDAIPFLHDLVRDKSYFDVQKVMHARPEKYQYVKQCKNYDPVNDAYCEGGYMGGDRSNMCNICKGTGKIIGSGEMDITTLRWPDNADELLDLAQLSHYVERPMPIVEFYRQEINFAQAAIFMTVFNQQGISVEDFTSVQTATQARIEYDKVYNKLSPFAELVARAWEKAYRVGFQYYGVTDADVDMTYPHDFKMKSLRELAGEYAEAKNAGMPYEVLWSLSTDALQKIYRNKPSRVNQIMAIEEHKPWRTKSPEEIALIIGNRSDTDPDRLLWENWDHVVSLIDERFPQFYNLEYDAQRQAIDAAMQEIAQRVQYNAPAAIPDAFMRAQEEIDAE